MKWQTVMKITERCSSDSSPMTVALRDRILELDRLFSLQCKISTSLRKELAEITVENKKLKAHRLSVDGLDLSTLLGYEAGLEEGKHQARKPSATEVWPRVYEMSHVVADQVEKALRDLGMTIPIATQLTKKDREIVELKREVKSMRGTSIRPFISCAYYKEGENCLHGEALICCVCFEHWKGQAAYYEKLWRAACNRPPTQCSVRLVDVPLFENP